MEEQLTQILNEMAEYLTVSQLRKLQEVLLKSLGEQRAHKKQPSNDEYLQMFINAKKTEGCSYRTLRYYESTVRRFLNGTNVHIRKITTDTIRAYLGAFSNRYNDAIRNC